MNNVYSIHTAIKQMICMFCIIDTEFCLVMFVCRTICQIALISLAAVLGAVLIGVGIYAACVCNVLARNNVEPPKLAVELDAERMERARLAFCFLILIRLSYQFRLQSFNQSIVVLV